MKYRQIIADGLWKAGWSWGCVSALDSQGQKICIADAHRDDGKRFIVRADEIRHPMLFAASKRSEKNHTNEDNENESDLDE